MIIEDSVEKKASYMPSGNGVYPSDNGLGEDMVYYMNKWKRMDEESREIYSNNRMNNKERKKMAVPKKKMTKKNISVDKVFAVIAVVASIGAVAIEHYNCANYITNQVVESGVIPNLDTLSVRDDSQFGLIFSYLDSYGNRQEMNGEYYIQMVVQNGDTNGFTTDQVAIALDHLGICHASVVDGSSLLGRIGQELLASSQLLSNDHQQSSGRRS